MAASLYTFKKALLFPHTAYMRRREHNMDPVARQVFELNYFRKPVYDFLEARMYLPDLLVDMPIDEECIVFDVGAFVGHWSEQISNRYHSQIYAFEPAPPALRQMEESLAGHPNIRQLPYGLGGRDQVVALELEGPGSNIYGSRTGAESPTVDVSIRDVVGVIDELGIDHIDLLKVNIEGGEYDLFDRLIDSGLMPKIDLVLVQFHEWHPKAYRRRRHIRRALRHSHEELWDYPFIWEYWHRRVDSRHP